MDVVPQETQWGSLGVGHAVVMCSHAQMVQWSGLVHLSLKWPYSWHLLHHIGSCRSLLTTTLVLAMKTHSLRSLLAASANAQVILTLASCWLGALSSSFFDPCSRCDGVQGKIQIFFYLM